MAYQAVPFNKSQGSDTTLATAAAFITRPRWACAFEAVTGGDFEWLFTEELAAALFFDSGGTYTDLKAELVDGFTPGTGTGTGTTLDSMSTTDILYLGFRNPISGIYVDVEAANGTANTIDVEYYNGAWTDITETDGTASGGASFAVDGEITWTALTDWVRTTVNSVGTFYWIRIKFSVALDSDTSLFRILGIQNSRTYAQVEAGTSGDGVVPMKYLDRQRVGGIEVKAAAGTPVCSVNWYGRN
jgi:hypothetical protein